MIRMKLTGHEIPDSINPAKKIYELYPEVKSFLAPPVSDNREVENNFETMPENKPAVPSNKGIQLDEKHFDEKGQSEWIQDRRFYQKAVNNVAKNFSNATFRLDEVSPYGAKVIVTIDGKDQELTKSKVARADFKRLFGKSLEEMQTVESKPEPAKIVNEPAIPDKAVTDFIKKKKAQALGYGGSGKLISQSVFDNSKEMEFLAKYKDIITDTQLDPSISKQQANLLQYLPTDLSKKNYELVSDKDNNDKRYNVQKKLIDFSNQLKTKQLASNVIAELQKILSTHEYHTGDYTSNVDILLKRIEPYQRISSNTSPAKNPDLKANFESWKEERKTASPAFKLEQEDLTSKEKNTRFNDAQGGLFGKKPVTHESYAKKDFKPSLALEGNETITSLVTAVKSALMREGLDTKAREFVDKAFKEKDISSLKKLASEYVDMKESSQVSNPSTENKGSEEKKMENSVNEAKKQELLEIGDLLVADNNSTTWNTFSNSEKARNKDLFTGRVNKFLPKIQTTVSTENVSPKQISYAEAAKYSNIDLVRTTFKNKLTSSKNKEEFTKVLDHMVKLDTLLNSKTDTLWWLKNKDMGYKSYQELQKMFPNTLK